MSLLDRLSRGCDYFFLRNARRPETASATTPVATQPRCSLVHNCGIQLRALPSIALWSPGTGCHRLLGRSTANQTQSATQLTSGVSQPFTSCCDPRLRFSGQRDRNVRARGRVQRAMDEAPEVGAYIKSSRGRCLWTAAADNSHLTTVRSPLKRC